MRQFRRLFLLTLLATAATLLAPLFAHQGDAQAQRGPAPMSREAPPRGARPGDARQGTAGPRIWFSPADPHFRAQAFHTGEGDFTQLFQPGAPWANAAARVGVFKVGKDYLNVATDQELRTVLGWLQQHRILLAVEAPMLTPTATCGHTEGYGINSTLAAMQKVKRLGFTVDILSAGESLWFGHFYGGPSACRNPIPVVVANQVQSARLVQAIFPAIRIDDIEPISNFPANVDWVATLGEWMAAFRQGYGQPYAAMELDIAWWQAGWQGRAQAISQYLRRAGMPIGVIYDGNSPEQLAYNWVLQAQQHWREYERIAGVPDEAIFQSWTAQPNDSLPETSSSAFTNDLLDYERFHRG